MDRWQEEYERKLVSAEEAIQVVKQGDRVAFTYGMEPLALGTALAARAVEVGGIDLYIPAPGRNFPWYEPGWEEFVNVEIGFLLPVARDMMGERRGDFLVSGLLWAEDPSVMKPVDVVLVELSTPDKHGYCSFGSSLWNKKQAVRSAKIALAEVNRNLIRTYGDNFIHISEIDYFIEHTPSGRQPGSTDMLGRKTVGPGQVEKQIAEHLGTLIKDGDTLEIGVGGAAEWVTRLGILDSKHDLGWHSENTPRGIATLVRGGVINGKRKTIHQGKAVATAVGGGSRDEMNYIDMNPVFEVYGADYVLDPKTIARNDNMVAINSAIAIDLTGQIAAESVGPVMVSGTGGQLAFALGAHMSRGGRNITALPSTAKGGTVSRITPCLEQGSIVTVPRTLADYVVTEYGIAKLGGKTQRERALELISVAHPDFRDELKKAALRLFWP